jgi:hypothetical protein
MSLKCNANAYKNNILNDKLNKGKCKDGGQNKRSKDSLMASTSAHSPGSQSPLDRIFWRDGASRHVMASRKVQQIGTDLLKRSRDVQRTKSEPLSHLRNECHF